MPRIAEKMPSPLKCLYRRLQKLGLSHWAHDLVTEFCSKDDFAPLCPSAKFPLVSPILGIMSTYLIGDAAKN
ncbi:hsp70-like protein [Colletotrichum scovillei]|uniref:Hsp70-like protein n=1 Tax=Colletotrichum scovillei TaxID=1209932 RepID=A0A9P7RE75_9PEZI|nr:hsp70-like protein [Colletotrichum scovillei]KAG7072315.1 hsp70-like protein [Colletotrichum scovillei]KAG7080753.1 hsp70-like protein [Colletotrichum scovillei]